VTITISQVDEVRVGRILGRDEGQFCDFKAKEIKPAKLSVTLAAFANADGGEVFVGVTGPKLGPMRWDGFENPEAANDHIQVIEQLFPIGDVCRVSFLESPKEKGLLLHIEVDKTIDIRKATDGSVFLRRGAQNLPQDTEEKLDRLKLNKGISSYEDMTVSATTDTITNSLVTLEFMLEAVPAAEPDAWLTKNRVIVGGKPTVAGIMLYSDEPQTDLPKASIKIYRYKTSDAEGTRAALDFDPIAIEGCAYKQIYAAVEKIREITEKIPLLGIEGLVKISYPTEAIHEIVTNAVIHRDYSINDDIHVRIFDNRIEVQSPGTLPGHVTVKNILAERASRNSKLVRLLNKFHNPPNKDVGEGLNTAFQAMRSVKLRDPVIEQKDLGVLVSLRHEKLGTPEQIIVEYLRSNEEINNATARQICFIGSENTVKRVFQKMINAGLIDRIPDLPLNKTGYVKGKNFPIS